jgi:sulfotransferase family protein
MERSIVRINKPIFIVGSPRSGTSILSWCLGQHPNILVQEESNWLGRFAIDVALAYERGTLRGELAQLSAMDVQREEFFALFGKSINKLILDHRGDLELKRLRNHHSAIACGVARGRCWRPPSTSDTKARWVDGTPEYSFYICGLRKLFPPARFIHVVRDVTSVVRSMLNFHRVMGIQLVGNEEEAYSYWLRAVTACVEAEHAYGQDVIYRIHYSGLIEQPELAMRSLLDFLGEPYAAECLEPLVERINSSNVPVDFDEHEPTTDPKIIEQARHLSDHLQNSPQQISASAVIAEKLETEFNQRVQYFLDLEGKYSEAQRLVAKLQRECELLKKHHCTSESLTLTPSD